MDDTHVDPPLPPLDTVPPPSPATRQYSSVGFVSLSLPEKITQITATVVRPIITLTFTAIIVILTLDSRIEAKDVLLVYATLVAFWFGERSALKVPGQKNGE